MTQSTPPPPAATGTPATPPLSAQEQLKPSPRKRIDRIIIRPWPKIVFLYPTFITALILWFVSALSVHGHEGSEGLGNVFMLILFVNLMVFSFDFSRIKSITIVIAIIAVVAIIAWLNTKWQVLAGLSSVFGGIDMRMNTQFFGFFAGFLAFIYLVVLINSRFNYFEINHLEILHHHGYLGDIKRLPTTGLQFDKEIYDMLEFLLLRSGRLILYPQGLRQAVVIDNVLSVNKVEEGIKELLSVMAVTVED
jgi:hypothetical protein